MADGDMKGNGDTKFVVVIAGRNNAQWVVRCLYTVLQQKYKNYRVLYTDDFSTDGTFDIVNAVCKYHPEGHRVSAVRNETRKKLCANHVAMLDQCKDDEVAVFLDGDDWLPHKDLGILERLDSCYSKSNVWVTYGQFEYCEVSKNPKGSKMGSAQQMPRNLHTRKAGFHCAALRTCRVWLFNKIKREDLKYKGEWFFPCSDLAIMYPLIEMAGPDRAIFFSISNYVYNRANKTCISMTEKERQQEVKVFIEKKMKVYAVLKKREDEASYV